MARILTQVVEVAITVVSLEKVETLAGEGAAAIPQVHLILTPLEIRLRKVSLTVWVLAQQKALAEGIRQRPDLLKPLH